VTPIAPGATLGLLGGGQLGRMTALAARAMGYGVRVLDPDPACAASGVADATIAAAFDDADAAALLAAGVDVATYEIERIGAGAAAAVAARVPLRPGAAILAMVQDRAVQKAWLAAAGLPLGPWREAADSASAAAAVEVLGGPCRVKSRTGGYDGRGQARVAAPGDAAELLRAWGPTPCVVERELELAAELSVLVARRPSGEVAVYPPARNVHEAGILTVSQLPGELPAAACDRADAIARRLADELALEGLLAVELFLTTGGDVLVNELAPRPHNTFHTAAAACATGQFEQLVRAVCDLPLGDTRVVRPAALANLLGELWDGGAPPFERALALPGVTLSVYGKAPRPGRKLGHLVASADTPAAALALVEEARRRLSAR